MKGANPFMLWEEEPEGISGRKEESRAFSVFANAVVSRRAGAMLLTGAPGIGKTTMLRNFQQIAEKEGMLAPFVNVEKGEDEKEVSGKLWRELGALTSLPTSVKTPDSFDELLDGVSRLRKGHFGAVLLIDDIDLMRKPDEVLTRIAALLKEEWEDGRVSFVMSSTRGLEGKTGLVSVMTLKPFDEHEARELIEKALKKGPPKMGEECLQLLLRDTGGNPKLLKSVCHDIYARLRENEKVITKGHYLSYLPQIMGSLSRGWFGGMYQRTPPAERAILRLLAKNEDGMHVSDIARNLGKALGPITALTKRLLERGQIERVERGRYRVFSRLYARYVSQRG